MERGNQNRNCDVFVHSDVTGGGGGINALIQATSDYLAGGQGGI